MLQQNPLYRRIQRSNLFKTFTRPYTRHIRGSLSTQNTLIRRLTDHTPNDNNPLLRTLESQNSTSKTVNVQSMTQRLERNRQTTLNQRSKASLNQTHQFSRQGTTGMQSAQSYRERRQVMSQGGSRLSKGDAENMSSKVSLQSWNQRKTQKFKLRACLQRKPVHYDTEWDETDFSLLQLKRRNMIEKYQQQSSALKNPKQKLNDQNMVSYTSAVTPNGSKLSKYSKVIYDSMKIKSDQN